TQYETRIGRLFLLHLTLLCYCLPFFFFYLYGDHRDLHSFPTRRSSDLFEHGCSKNAKNRNHMGKTNVNTIFPQNSKQVSIKFDRDRKSTRLNSSHVAISYAVFCLKKKKG